MKSTRIMGTVAMLIAAIGLTPFAAHAATLTTSTTAPTEDGSDVAMLNLAGATGQGKFWAGEGFAAGQTFTTASGSVGYRLNAVTFRYHGTYDPNNNFPNNNKTEYDATKTYGVRVVTIAGTDVTEVQSELAVHGTFSRAGDYLTLALQDPVVLNANKQYGVDFRMTASTSGWQTGIPTVSKGGNNYAGGQSYILSQWTDGNKGNWTDTDLATAIFDANRDFVFHVDMTAIPTQGWDGTNNNWDTAHWIPMGGGPLGMPVANQGMLVNSGTVHVLSDLSASYPAQSLLIARDAPHGGTVNIGNGAAGHLRVTSFVDVNAGGTLNVNNGRLEAGEKLSVLGGTVDVGVAGRADATVDVIVDAGGTLNVAGVLNTPTLNTAGTTTFQSTSSGTIAEMNVTGGTTTMSSPNVGTLNADAGTLNYNSTNTQMLNANGAQVNMGDGSSVVDLNVAAGAVNVGAGVSATNVVVRGGQINAGPNALIVGSELKLGNEITITGTNVGVGGTITDSGLGRVELNGGAVTLAVLGAPAATGISYFEISNDTDARISSADTVTHAIDWGNNNPRANVNGVQFASEFNVAAGGRANAGTRTYGPNNHGGNNPPAVSGQVGSVFRDMRYNGPDGGYLELTGLTPGEWYDVRMYDRAWDYNGSIRTLFYEFDVGGDGNVEYTTQLIDQNRGDATAPGVSGNVSWASSYVYQADSTGKMRVVIDLAPGHGGTYHLYGLSNQVAPSGDGIIDWDTDIVANSATTLVLDSVGPVALADLIIADLAAIVTIGAGPPQVGFEILSLDPNIALSEGTFRLLEWDQGTQLTDFASQDFTVADDAGYNWSLNEYLQDGYLELTLTSGAVIPEPATMALLSLAACGLGGYVRRRRKA